MFYINRGNKKIPFCLSNGPTRGVSFNRSHSGPGDVLIGARTLMFIFTRNILSLRYCNGEVPSSYVL